MGNQKSMAEIAKDITFEEGDEIIEGEEVVETTEEPEVIENIKKDEIPENGQPKVDEVVTPPAKVETVTPPTFDPIAYVDSLDIPDDQKKIMKDGFLRQSDYTRKTQEISKIQKDYDEYQTRGKPILDRIFADPKLLKIVLGIEDENAEIANEDIPPEDPVEYAKWVEARIFKKIEDQQLEHSKRQDKENEEKQYWEARRSDALQAEKLDPRLTSDVEFQQIVAGIVLQDERYKTGQLSAVEATKQAIAFVDRRIKSVENKAKEDLVNKAKTNKTLIGNDNSPAEVVGTKPKNMREALKNVEAKGLLN